MRVLTLFVVGLVVLQAAGRVEHEIKPHRCLKCPPGWGVVERCTRQKDTVCEKCEYGKSYSPHYSSKSACWLCSRCGIGLYEAQRCSLHRDTVCNECITFIGQKNFIEKNDFHEKCSYVFIDQHKTQEPLTDNLHWNH